ncbi:MAG TPA: hypothetical protein VKV03_10770 [Candidatus Binataceae bacterium]|nr:hypothetical protein [Candidatus Binataceae bacterium]
MKILNLREFVASRTDEVSQVVAGIKGRADSILWTAKMRPSVRGGKPLGGPRIDDQSSDSDR